ncbi:MAG: hypothetical protein WCF84_26875 [Anaerolineae bacterium]
MADEQNIEEREAEHGERMIELKVRFWTNDIADGKDAILPKHAWSSGVVRIVKNKAHGIEPQKPQMFYTLMDLPAVIEKVLIAHGIKLQQSRKMGKYFETAKRKKRKKESR